MEVVLEPLMKEFKHVFMEKYEFENQDAIIDNLFGIFGRSRTGSKKYAA